MHACEIWVHYNVQLVPSSCFKSLYLVRFKFICFHGIFTLQVQTDLEYIKEDMNAVERHRMELYRARERYSVKLRMLDDPMSRTNWPSSVNKHGSIATSNAQSCQDGSGSASLHTKKVDPKLQGISQVLQKRSSLNGSDSQNVGGQSGLAVARRRRVNAQVGY